jgi:uncharacterized protein YjiS (DUF1127 family)
MATITRDAHGAPSPLDLTGRLRPLLARFRTWNAARRARAEILADLAMLDARDLRDLAISRYDFSAIAEGRFRR